ncbi:MULTISPECIES: AAA family ATPase [Rhodopseudomonas]|uniref:AAA family ATPase n=1 Tax=Rhodopseudomonas TaxID=1073 RepID=UPI001F1A975D|nr:MULTISPECIES: AAA family ATPase [Rhodopseudomonas]MDF3810742.1 AAA family ATPase [Rhodopseudomonas sp. BAL398]WOK20546.1 AAA family ATPase [Rhodopseudomonas sp. BAL398]
MKAALEVITSVAGDGVYISEIRIENFRLFGVGNDTFVLPLKPGLTALVGENDGGKTAVIDALRLVLGTRDQELIRVEATDFHQAPGGAQAEQICIRLTFKALTVHDRAAFAEYLTYLPGGDVTETALIITWNARRNTKEGVSRRTLPSEIRTGAAGDGPVLEGAARALLTATYLRPLRDAERAMSAGRGSRLSQILQHTKEIRRRVSPSIRRRARRPTLRSSAYSASATTRASSSTAAPGSRKHARS